MSGVPEGVLIERIRNCLERAAVAWKAKRHEEGFKELRQAKEWLDQLREAMR